MKHNDCNCGSSGPCPMQMVFHAGHCESILLRRWTVTNVIEFSCAAVALYALAFCYEALRYYTNEHLRQATGRGDGIGSAPAQRLKGSSSIAPLTGFSHKSQWHHMTTSTHLFQTLLYVLQVVTSYVLMLVVMSYNLWLCLAVLLGLSMGYFSFGWLKRGSLGITDCCH